MSERVSPSGRKVPRKYNSQINEKVKVGFSIGVF